MNLYAYAGNNPVAFRDPLGLCEEAPKGGTSDCERFAQYIEHLAGITDSDAEFIDRLRTEVAGLPGGLEGSARRPQVSFGSSGFRPALVDDGNPARHYAAYVALSYEATDVVADAVAVIREVPRGIGGPCHGGCSVEDIKLGVVGSEHGARLRNARNTRAIGLGIPVGSRHDLAKWIRDEL